MLEVEIPPIMQYTNLLHRHRNPAAPEVAALVQTYRGDAVFLKRVEVLNKVFRLKMALVRGLIDREKS